MEKKRKSLVALALVGMVGVLSIAYAAYSTTLHITIGDDSTTDPKAKISVWNVHFDETAGATSSTAYVKGSDGSYSEHSNGDTTVNTQPGTVTISKSTGSTVYDTATIEGVVIASMDDYVIYKLPVKNDSSVTAYLQENPSADISITVGDSSEKTNISSDIYTNAACSTEANKGDQIAAGSSTNWYVKVAYTGTTAPTSEVGFKITYAPVWGSTATT